MFGDASLSPTKIEHYPFWKNRASSSQEEEDEEDPEVGVSATLDGEPVPKRAYYATLDRRLVELQQSMGTPCMPSSYEKLVVGGVMPPPHLMHAKEYYDQLRALRADSQVYYSVANEVHSDLMWDDVDLEDHTDYTHCRYTPVTTEDARDFGKDGYTLRIQHHNPRQIKLLVCVTLYNEDQDTLGKTLQGICENLEVLYKQHGKNGSKHGLDWQEVAIAIIQDGCNRADSSVMAASTVQGFYSENLKIDEAVGLPVSLHMFEYTARYKKHAGLDCYPPLQVIFATKTTNRGKLDSHCWFFDGIAHSLQPEYCVLFDAGTKPLPMALRNCYAHFQNHPGCGALTGELRVERPYRNFVTSVQYMEWKVSHFLSKPIESVCGYLTVLPGAFSAFRWAAVEGEPLRRYFYGLYSQAELSAFEANMYLAEDRVLCLEIVARKGSAYYLQYVKEAVAEADPVTKLSGLIKQRRRWLNGTFFAMIYTLSNWSRIWTESRHSFARKLILSIESVYLIGITATGTWLGIGIYYSVLSQLFKVLFTGSTLLTNIGTLLTVVYLMLIVVQVVVNLKNKPEAVEKLHLFCTVFFILFMIAFTVILIWSLSSYSLGAILSNISQVGVLLTFSALVMTATLHGDGGALMGAGIQYWCMQLVFLNILQVNAFCNTDDVTWGTKNLDTKKDVATTKTLLRSTMAYGGGPATRESKAFWKAMMKVHEKLTDVDHIRAYNVIKEQKLRTFATSLLIAWLVSNIVFVQVVAMISDLTWESCSSTPGGRYAAVVSSLMTADDTGVAVGQVVYAAQAILTTAASLYPFGGLPNWPAAYPMLVAGAAQSNSTMGQDVTVLTSSTDLMSSLPSSLPSFGDWLNYSAGINFDATVQELNLLDLPTIGNGTESESVCTQKSGRDYYLTIQFTVLCALIGFQVLGSFFFIFGYYWRRMRWKVASFRVKRRMTRAAEDAVEGKKRLMAPGFEDGTAGQGGIGVPSLHIPAAQGGLDPMWYQQENHLYDGEDDGSQSSRPSTARSASSGVASLRELPV